jgi:transcriptional regulator with GAF, ATPase, and Fis domain
MLEELDRASGELAASFVKMGGLIFSEVTLQSALDVMSMLAHEILPGTTGAGVMLIHGRQRTTVAYSDGEVVKAADDLQYGLNEGPCLTAITTAAAVRIDCVESESRWPDWSTRAAKLGMGSILTVPLLIRDGAIGAVKVYSREPFNYDERSQRIMELFAQQAGTVLTNVKDYAEAQELGDQLREALESRDMIGMAKGILMSRENVDESTAFDMLRQLSQNQNIKVKDVAFRLLRSARAAG